MSLSCVKQIKATETSIESVKLSKAVIMQSLKDLSEQPLNESNGQPTKFGQLEKKTKTLTVTQTCIIFQVSKQ